MRMSGQKTRAVFERYNPVIQEDLRDAVQRIEGARLPSKTSALAIRVRSTRVHQK